MKVRTEVNKLLGAILVLVTAAGVLLAMKDIIILILKRIWARFTFRFHARRERSRSLSAE